jgi:hypothetical protein
MQTPGYYALPFRTLPDDVHHNLNKMTLFSQPNDRLVKLANELVMRNPISFAPTTQRKKFNDILKVRNCKPSEET